MFSQHTSAKARHPVVDISVHLVRHLQPAAIILISIQLVAAGEQRRYRRRNSPHHSCRVGSHSYVAAKWLVGTFSAESKCDFPSTFGGRIVHRSYLTVVQKQHEHSSARVSVIEHILADSTLSKEFKIRDMTRNASTPTAQKLLKRSVQLDEATVKAFTPPDKASGMLETHSLNANPGYFDGEGLEKSHSILDEKLTSLEGFVHRSKVLRN